jgi:hypothetical protein
MGGKRGGAIDIDKRYQETSHKYQRRRQQSDERNCLYTTSLMLRIAPLPLSYRPDSATACTMGADRPFNKVKRVETDLNSEVIDMGMSKARCLPRDLSERELSASKIGEAGEDDSAGFCDLSWSKDVHES